MAWMATDLLASVRRRARLSSSSTQGVTDADLLSHADDEMASTLVPLILSVQEEHSVYPADIPIVAGQQAYRMPSRNVGGKVRNVSCNVGGVEYPLTRYEQPQVTGLLATQQGQPQGFQIQGGSFLLWPTPSTSGTLRLPYFTRPGRLTKTAAEYGVVTNVTSGFGAQLQLDVVNSFSLGQKIDIIAFRPPFEYLHVELEIVGWSGVGLTLATPWAGTLVQNGDYVTTADKSPVMQCPVELHSLLVELVVRRVMMQFGFAAKVATCDREIERLRAQALVALTPRTGGAARKVVGLMQREGVTSWRR